MHRTFLRLRRQHPLTVRVLALAGETTAPGWSEEDGIPVRRLAARVGYVAALRSAAAHLWGERAGGFDLVYCVTTGRVVYAAGVWARLLRRPLVVEFVNNNIEETPYRRLMAGRLARSAALTIAISRPIFNQFRRLGVPEGRIWLRPNPVDTGRFRLPGAEERAASRRRFGIRDDTILHVLIGALSRRKNHEVGVGAIERLPPPHRLIVAGPVLPGEEAYAAALAARIGASPAGERVSLITGFVPDIEQLMYAADCLWMPSLEEVLGNVMLEALCCGVPCIISDRLGLDEHISDGRNGIKAAPAAAAWTAAARSITGLITDGAQRRALAERAGAAYDFRAIDAELLRRLQRVVGRDADPGQA
ncbi:MAG TPA: glycosyltransferase family 4 protein [Rhodospirillales bacterium]|nr:glycosyltransferase family 4 protein [Rhodospirillales bacterium]